MTQIFKNNASGRLSGAHISSVLIINMVDSSVFPVPGAGEWYLVTMYKVTNGVESDFEIIQVTANDTGTNQLTVIRNQEGSGAKSYADGDYIELRATAGMLDQLTAVVANDLLDDYEEGTWTPVLTSGSIGDCTQIKEEGSYVKVGRKVTVDFVLEVSDLGTLSPSGQVRIEGLPFQCANAVNLRSAGSSLFSEMNTLRGDYIGIVVYWSATYISLFLSDVVAESGQVMLTSDWTTSGSLRGSVTYLAAT